MLEQAVHTAARPTRAEISVEALRHNLRTVADLVGPEVAVMAVVKANAYGHGMLECARIFADGGAAWLGVALPEEGVALREAGLGQPILCLGGFWNGQESMLLDFDLTPAISRLDQLERLNAEAAHRGRTAPVHLKIDTGMGRLGLSETDFDAVLPTLAKLRNIEIDGLMTHLASSDVPALDDYSREQIARFDVAEALLRRAAVEPRWIHLANGATLHAYPESHGNLVRPGAILYGLKRDILSPVPPDLDVRPAMRFVTRVVHLKTVPPGTSLGYGCSFTTTRESVIATIPAGYADGVRRALSNRGAVGVHGAMAPIVGRVSMDLTIVDVTGLDGVAIGDEVVIFGDGGPPAEDVAELAGTVSYELACGVSARVPRVFR